MQSLALKPLIDRVERLQSISRLSEDEWLDLLQMTWRDYRRFLFGQNKIQESTVQRILKFFEIDLNDFLIGNLDFDRLSSRFHRAQMDFPEEFMVGAHGRRRTTITSLEFMEKKYGWRLRHDILQHFQVDPAALRDPFAPVSIRFLSEACLQLKKRQFKTSEFFEMGQYSYTGNSNSIIARSLSEVETLEELYERFFNEFIFLYENNCTYSFSNRSFQTGILTSRTNPEVARELGVQYVGNELICELKRGMWASLPRYMGYSDAHISHIQCEHRGDEACVSLIDLSGCTPLRDKH